MILSLRQSPPHFPDNHPLGQHTSPSLRQRASQSIPLTSLASFPKCPPLGAALPSLCRWHHHYFPPNGAEAPRRWRSDQRCMEAICKRCTSYQCAGGTPSTVGKGNTRAVHASWGRSSSTDKQMALRHDSGGSRSFSQQSSKSWSTISLQRPYPLLQPASSRRSMHQQHLCQVWELWRPHLLPSPPAWR